MAYSIRLRATTLVLLVLTLGCESVGARQEKEANVLLIKGVKDYYNDPDSVLLRELKTYKHQVAKGTHQEFVLCGEANAKNAYGGYVGYMRFYETIQLTDNRKLLPASVDLNLNKPDGWDKDFFGAELGAYCRNDNK